MVTRDGDHPESTENPVSEAGALLLVQELESSTVHFGYSALTLCFFFLHQPGG
jgi:hypothetical protein